MRYFSLDRDYYKHKNILLVPGKKEEFSKNNGLGDCVCEFVKIDQGKEPPKSYTVFEIREEIYILKRLWQGTDTLWLKHGIEYPESIWGKVEKVEVFKQEKLF